MSRFRSSRHLSALREPPGLPRKEVRRMRLLRRLAIGAALAIGSLSFAAPAGAASSSVAVTRVGASVASDATMIVAQQAPPPVVNVTPSSDGMPGAELVQKLLSWLSQLAL